MTVRRPLNEPREILSFSLDSNHPFHEQFHLSCIFRTSSNISIDSSSFSWYVRKLKKNSETSKSLLRKKNHFSPVRVFSLAVDGVFDFEVVVRVALDHSERASLLQ